MKRRGRQLPILGNPVAHPATLDPDEAGQLRRTDCRSYGECLGFAVAEGWDGFHCNACRTYEAPSPEEREHERLCALRFLAETQLIALIAAPDALFVDESPDDEDDDAASDQAAPSPPAATTAYDDEDEEDLRALRMARAAIISRRPGDPTN